MNEILTTQKEFFAFGLRKKWGESKKVEGREWERGKKRMLAHKSLDFEKPVCSDMINMTLSVLDMIIV